jgi:hypothetical protein
MDPLFLNSEYQFTGTRIRFPTSTSPLTLKSAEIVPQKDSLNLKFRQRPENIPFLNLFNFL